MYMLYQAERALAGMLKEKEMQVRELDKEVIISHAYAYIYMSYVYACYTYTYAYALLGRASSGWHAQIKRDARAGARHGGDHIQLYHMHMHIYIYVICIHM